MEDGWTEVRRRKTVTASDGNTTVETTFFITNIPNDATKSEFEKIFSQMGRLSDIYFGRNIGKNGKKLRLHTIHRRIRRQSFGIETEQCYMQEQ